MKITELLNELGKDIEWLEIMLSKQIEKKSKRSEYYKKNKKRLDDYHKAYRSKHPEYRNKVREKAKQYREGKRT